MVCIEIVIFYIIIIAARCADIQMLNVNAIFLSNTIKKKMYLKV